MRATDLALAVVFSFPPAAVAQTFHSTAPVYSSALACPAAGACAACPVRAAPTTAVAYAFPVAAYAPAYAPVYAPVYQPVYAPPVAYAACATGSCGAASPAQYGFAPVRGRAVFRYRIRR